MHGAGAGKQLLRLTVKEKVLLELRLHMCEEGLGEYPIELTQKGLSDCLGVRRSHIALSLQGLVEDKLVEVRKERIEGESRKQNLYTLTPTGVDKAKEVTLRVMSTKADFEMLEGVRRVSTEEFLRISKADMSSVVRQLERGSVVRDEITIITRPERKLITVYCPTCKRNLEVENTYANETVSFDCPGCGRPYKIAPAEKVEPLRESAIGRAWPVVVGMIALFGGVIGYLALGFSNVCSSIVVLVTVTLALVAFITARTTSNREHPRRAATATVSLVTIILGYGLVFVWSVLIASINLAEILSWYLPLVAAVALGYLGLAKGAPDLANEYLLVLGAFFAVLSVSLVSVEVGGLSLSSAPFIGVLGVALAVIASTHVMQRNTWTLDLLMAGGAFIILMSLGSLLWEVDSAIGWVAVGGLFVLGAVLVLLRPLQRRTDRPIGHIFVSALPFAVGALFLMTGVLMIEGGAVTAGAIEIALMAPFIYYGLRKVFDGDWMYKLPVASLLVSVEALSVAYAFMS